MSKRSSVRVIVGFAGAFLAGTAGAADVVTTKSFTVVDGNRIAVSGKELRLDGIVAPDLGRQCVLGGKARDCGAIARAGLLDLTAGATVTCRKAGILDGAPTHRCTADGYDLSECMVYTGWAVPLEGAPKVYWNVLKGARERPRGFWRGTFVEPWAEVARIAGD
ncbi:MAG: thermonuclease family protein [Hyphomicrobiales bacterium]